MSAVANHELVKSAPILSGPSDLHEFPDWFRDQQHAAWREFEGLPTPTRKDQAWRFSNVAVIDLAPFKISAPLSEDDRKNVLKYSRGLDHCAARIFNHWSSHWWSTPISSGNISCPLKRHLVRLSSLRCTRRSFRREHSCSCRAGSRSKNRSKSSIGCDTTTCRSSPIYFSSPT